MDKPVFKAPSAFTKLRELARVHEMLVGDVVRVQARLKFIYRSRAVSTTGTALYSPAKRAQWQDQLPEASRAVTSKLYAHYDFLLEPKKQAEQEMIAESHSYCGKGEPNQPIHCGHAAPACLFSDVDVFGGEARQ